MVNRPVFHLAFPIQDLEQTRVFYVGLLGCVVGREADTWIDFDFFGHQLSAHVVQEPLQSTVTSPVDGDPVPVRHFGVVLEWNDWHAMADRLRSAGVHFLIEPHIRFSGQIGEQATMFFVDPSGNALEFKTFRDMSRLFARSSPEKE